MAATNTPLNVIENLRNLIDIHHTGKPDFENRLCTINVETLQWLLNDAEHLNKLNSFAIERRFEDAQSMCEACADYEG